MKRVFQVRDGSHRYRLEVDAKLHQIGQQKPYFSITGELWRANSAGQRDARFNDCQACGCLHDDILKASPGLADLVAMHLSDVDGIPAYAESNGWFWLAGYLSYPNRQYAEYHGASEYSARTSAECLRIFADHCRITLEEAKRIAKLCDGKDNDLVRQRWAKQCEAMKPRWAKEAAAMIAKYGLEVVKS